MLLFLKIVHGIIATGKDDILRDFATAFGKTFDLGEIVNDSGPFRLYVLHITKFNDYSCEIYGDEKCKSFSSYPLPGTRRPQSEGPLDGLERKALLSINASIVWFGVSLSPFCSV